MAEFSFDITCGYDKQEFANALDQSKREILNRFDFKGVLANIDTNGNELTIHTESEPKVTAILDIIESKMLKRSLPLSVLEKPGKIEEASGSTIRNKIKLIDSLTQEQAKAMTKILRDELPKVKANIQGDSVRVISKSKDDLQEAIQILRKAFPNLPLQFTNYR